ncbi:cation diffusion facilitator family transporter [Lysinibacillus sp. KU-BSD001]|uniref:cation diffusion facilitator family transporter n=1 Tax=Lysinibacillus sp. KU-BSD001 TaxID=3141328 RepID=UPI0036E8A94A
MELYTNLRAGEKGAWLSIGTYIFLSAMKLIVGYIGMSAALKADGLNNTTDIIASIAVLIGLRISQKPPDVNHQYGHLRAETIASLIASFIMMVVGLQVLSTSIRGLFQPIEESPSMLTAIVALFSALIMYVVYRYNLALANKIKSSAVRAAAYDNRSDALVSIGTAIGIFGAIFGFPIIDTITALIVGLIIIKTAIEIFWEAVVTLTDGFDAEETETLKKLIANVDGVIDLLDLKGRSHGNMSFVDVTVTVNPNLNVIESHTISDTIEATVQRFNPHCIVLVHIEPHYIPTAVEEDYHF